MNKKMDDQEIEKIAQAIAAKLAEPRGIQPLGCGSASSPADFYCTPTGSYACNGYRCGGPGWFTCPASFRCVTTFDCDPRFECGGYYDSF